MKALIAALALLGLVSTAHADCERISPQSSVGYINIREEPNIHSRVVIRINNAGEGSDWDSLTWCGESWTNQNATTVWLLVHGTTFSGIDYSGWASAKVLDY